MKPSSRNRIILLLRCAAFGAVPAFLFLAPPAPSLSRSFSIKPVPSWVDQVAVSYAETEFARKSGSGAVCLLSDRQTRVGPRGVERYFRDVNRVMNATGLDDVAQIDIDFEPTYQQLTIHYIQIRRGEETINALEPSEIKLIQQEEELDQRLYNGTLSAVAFLSGVRAGDVVDCAYTIAGDNPVLGGKYADEVWMWNDIPTQMLRWRLVWPSNRTLARRGQHVDLPSVREMGDETEYLWERTDVSKNELEFNAPDWFEPYPMIKLSEFSGWGDVVQWAQPLYQVKRPFSRGLVSEIDRFREQSPTADGRLVAALRFVQDEIRYLGIELGSYSHTPTQPSAVCDRRFGDCKDKSLLLVTALRELGIEADPALVNTNGGEAVVNELPSPYAFNHVIVRAAVDGKVYWFDPTISLQRGGLSEHYNPGYGKALVVRDGVSDLEEIPVPEESEPTTYYKQIYTADGSEGPASLEVIAIYRRGEADQMRHLLSQYSVADLDDIYLGYYERTDPEIKKDGPLEVKDDPDSNTIITTERYRLPAFWKNQRRALVARQIPSMLKNEVSTTRGWPLALDYPYYISETIEARLTDRFSISPESGSVATDSLDFRYSFNSQANVVTLNYQLRVLKDHVPAEQMGKHAAAVERIQQLLGLEITSGGQSRSGGGRSRLTTYLPLLLVFGPFVVFGVLKLIVNRKQRVRRGDFRERLKVSPGATAEAAIAVESPDEFGSHLSSVRCACGGGVLMPEEPIDAETIILAGRRVSVVSVKCERCPRSTDVYFAIL